MRLATLEEVTRVVRFPTDARRLASSSAGGTRRTTAGGLHTNHTALGDAVKKEGSKGRETVEKRHAPAGFKKRSGDAPLTRFLISAALAAVGAGPAVVPVVRGLRETTEEGRELFPEGLAIPSSVSIRLEMLC